MKLMLSSLALLATFTVAATAQTTTHKAATTTTPIITAATSNRRASKIPSVPGIPKTLYTLKYIDTIVGTGPLAEPHKWYTVHYTGWLTDGTKFDSSDDHPGGEPITFPYGAHRVIPGWDTGFEGMHVGGKRRLFIPYQLAYGETGRPPVIPAKADLIFDVELVAMSDTPPASRQPQPAPADPTAQPASRIRSSRITRPGDQTGHRHPDAQTRNSLRILRGRLTASNPRRPKDQHQSCSIDSDRSSHTSGDTGRASPGAASRSSSTTSSKSSSRSSSASAIDDMQHGLTEAKSRPPRASPARHRRISAAVFLYITRQVIIGASREIEYDLRNDLFANLERQSASFFHTHRTGDIMARTTNDLNAVRQLLGPAIMYSANTIVFTAAALPFMIRISPKLTLCAFVPLPIASVLVQYFGARIHRRFERIQAMFSDISAKAQENFSGARLIRAFAQEEAEIASFETANREYIRRSLYLVRLMAMLWPTLEFVLGLSLMITLLVGGHEVVAHRISVGQFTTFIVYMVQLTWPMIAVGWVVNLFQRGTASVVRIDELLKQKPSIADEPAATAAPITGDIEFRNLTFAYPERARRSCTTSTSTSPPAPASPSSAPPAPANRRWSPSFPACTTHRPARS